VAQADLDHIGFAVNDAADALRSLYGSGVILPIAGEEDDEFRWVIGRRQLRLRGIRAELLDPNHNESSFLARYLRSHSEGAHHVTFMVDDIDDTLAHLHDAQISVIQVNRDYPPWREAFIHPESGLGTVVQVASSIYTYPSGCQHGSAIDPKRMPHRRSGRHRDWWRRAIDATVEPTPVTITEVSLGVSDGDLARRLFADVLGGRQVADIRGHARYEWPSGSIVVSVANSPRINVIHFQDGGHLPNGEFTIGKTLLRRRVGASKTTPTSPNGVDR
jgi:methylmalonyl-CoA/ethylmalonyl-CoA epimerase